MSHVSSLIPQISYRRTDGLCINTLSESSGLRESSSDATFTKLYTSYNQDEEQPCRTIIRTQKVSRRRLSGVDNTEVLLRQLGPMRRWQLFLNEFELRNL